MTARTGFAAFTGTGRTQQNQDSLSFHQNQGAPTRLAGLLGQPPNMPRRRLY